MIIKTVLILAMVAGAWASDAAAQKDVMHLGEQMEPVVIRKQVPPPESKDSKDAKAVRRVIEKPIMEKLQTKEKVK